MPRYINTTSNINKENIRLYNYQQEAKNKNGIKTTICNWSRGLGKTYTLSSIILNERPNNVLYICKTSDGMRNLIQKFNEIFELHPKSIKGVIQDLKVMKDKIIIQYFDGIRTTVYDYAFMPIGSNKDIVFDYIMFDDLLPMFIDYQCNRVISMVTINNYNNKLEQLYKHNTVVLNEDYSAGIKNGLLDINKIDKFKEKNYWYDWYAILDNSKQIPINTNKPNVYVILDTLFNEINCLMPKIAKARENEEFGTYKNLILAYKEVLLLINDTYKQYGLKMKSENNIKEKIVYADVYIPQDARNVKIIIYSEDNIYILDNPNLSMIDHALTIKNIFKDDDYVIFYLDTHGFGRGLYDILKGEKGFDVRELKIQDYYKMISK